MLYPTLYTSLPNHLVSAADTTLYFSSSLMTRSFRLFSPSVAMPCREVSMGPSQSTSDRTFQDPRCQTGERLRPALCAFIGRSLTWESCRFSAWERAGDGRSGNINRRPALTLILLLVCVQEGAVGDRSPRPPFDCWGTMSLVRPLGPCQHRTRPQGRLADLCGVAVPLVSHR